MTDALKSSTPLCTPAKQVEEFFSHFKEKTDEGRLKWNCQIDRMIVSWHDRGIFDAICVKCFDENKEWWNTNQVTSRILPLWNICYDRFHVCSTIEFWIPRKFFGSYRAYLYFVRGNEFSDSTHCRDSMYDANIIFPLIKNAPDHRCVLRGRWQSRTWPARKFASLTRRFRGALTSQVLVPRLHNFPGVI